MRTFATLIDLALLITIGVLIADSGVPKGKDLWFFVLVVLAPLTSLIALRFNGAQDWLSLLLQRKALEEKRRIEELNRKP
jgi:hypothetical protein